MQSYLRFSLSGLTGTVTRATLRLYAYDGTSDGPRVYLSGGGWTEGGLTWNSRPTLLAGPMDDKGAISSNTWVEFDVTSVVRGNGELNLALVATSGNGTDFYSRESSQSDLRPQLVVTVETTPPPPTDCMPRTDTYVSASTPSEDGYVSRSEPDLYFGESRELLVDGSPWLETYLKLSPFTEGLTIREARLELYAFNPTSDGPRLYRASNDWTEGGLTWNTRPSLLGGVIGNLGAINANTVVSYDLTGVVTTEEDYSFALLPDSSNGVDFYSGDAIQGELLPRLVVRTESPTFCTYRGTGGGLTDWIRQYGGAGAEWVDVVAPHPEGGFVVAGRFGEAAFPQSEGLALARYTADGSALWSRVVATDDVMATDVTVTSLGNILVVGNYHNAPDLGTGALPSAPETEAWMAGFFIAKFSPSGEPVWSRGFVARNDRGALEPVRPHAVATDANGSLLVTGGFAGQMDLGGGLLESGSTSTPGFASNTGGFLAKYAWTGQHLWSRAFRTHTSIQRVQGRAVSTDAAGNVLVGGSASAMTDLGDGPLGEDGMLGDPLPFLAKYTPTGSLLWKRVFSGAHGEVVGIQPQGTNRIVFSANIGGTFTFAGETYQGGTFPESLLQGLPTNGFIGAMTTTGGDVGLRSVGSGLTLWFDELAVGSDGSIFVSGTGNEEFNAGGGPLGFAWGSPFVPTNRPFVARYTALGEHLWSRAFDQGRSLDMALLPDGGVVLGTTLGGTLELDGRTFTPVGDSDLLYLKLKP